MTTSALGERSVARRRVERLIERRRHLGSIGAIDFLLERELRALPKSEQDAFKGLPRSAKAEVGAAQQDRKLARDAENKRQASKKSNAKSLLEDRNVKNEVRRLNQGFVPQALRRLKMWAYGPVKNEARAQTARWELARWSANQNDIENKKIAEDLLRKLVRDAPVGLKDKHARILLADVLVELRKSCDAAECLSPLLDTGGSEDMDCSLAMAKVVSAGPGFDESCRAKVRLSWINDIWRKAGLETALYDEIADSSVTLDDLHVEVEKDVVEKVERPKVSVGLPCFNSAHVMGTAIDSLLKQTWDDIEIIIVDDCSGDATQEIGEKYQESDGRVRYVRLEKNKGCYNARNTALELATGEYFTCHDADDWSHPRKIEWQVLDLLADQSAVANMSPHCRVLADLAPERRGNPGFYVFPNLSSIMFPRNAVIETVGYWDNVYFGADGEFKKRIERAFGKGAIRTLNTAPLSLVRVHEESLTASPGMAYKGVKQGARLEHEQVASDWHDRCESQGTVPYMPRKPEHRPYRVPAILDGVKGRRKYDIVIMSDFRLPGGTTSSNIHEAIASKLAGYSVALVHAGAYTHNPEVSINSRVRTVVNSGYADFLTYGEAVDTALLIIRFPPVLSNLNTALPEINARDARIVCNQPPQRTWGDDDLLYDIDDCHQTVIDRFGVTPKWHPIGPTARAGFDAVSSQVELGGDWVNLIDVDAWSRGDYQPNGDRVVIGRHSRDHWSKWPDTKEMILQCYPDASNFAVNVLGGAKSAEKLIGDLPENWTVWGFGEREPKEFLAELDVYVYVTHSGYLEAFGRSIFEAMAVGVPVILPPRFKETFGGSAHYAESSDIMDVAQSLVADERAYKKSVDCGRKFVKKQYGYDVQKTRVKNIVGY